MERFNYFVAIGLGAAKIFRKLPSELILDQISSAALTAQKKFIIVASPVAAVV